MVGDFAVLHAHYINRFEMNFAMRRSNSEEWAIVRTVIGFRSSLDRRPPAASESPRVSPVTPRACRCRASGHGPYRGCSGLGGAIHEIVREEFFEGIEVAFALDIFGISADNGFRGFGRSDAVHFVNLFAVVSIER